MFKTSFLTQLPVMRLHHNVYTRNSRGGVHRVQPRYAPNRASTRLDQQMNQQHGKEGTVETASPYPPEVAALLTSPELERPAGVDPFQSLKTVEAFWTGMKNQRRISGPTIIHRHPGSFFSSNLPPDYDVIILGGTLGIFAALTLQNQGHKVCVLEKRLLQGRSQEWNISRSELQELITLGLLTAEELEECVATEWQHSRISMHKGTDLTVEGVLNLGVCPKTLIEILKQKFLAAGGVIKENTGFKAGQIYDDGVVVEVLAAGKDVTMTPGDVNRPMALEKKDSKENNRNGSSNGSSSSVVREDVTGRLVLDCMGHFSPIVRQIRGGLGQEPDGMVLVLGGAFAGIPKESNTSADLIATIDDASNDMQLFWEAFPSDGGALRTAYMFTYTDLDASRPSFTELLQTFVKKMPQYQGVPMSDLSCRRLLMGGFPCYMTHSPLPPAFDRLLQIGDSAAMQSPLSFGGFASLLRHLPRLSRGLNEALVKDKLDRGSLRLLHPYQPCLSLAWLFQRAMSMRVGQLKTTETCSSSLSSKLYESNGYPGSAAFDGSVGRSDANGSVTVSNSRNGALNKGTNNGVESSKAELKSNMRSRGWLPADHINRLMRCNFAVLSFLGQSAVHSFLLETMKLLPLSLTMLGMMLKDPVVVTRVLFQVGPGMILNWFKHFAALALYSVLYKVLRPLRKVMKENWTVQRVLDALQCGSSL